MQGNEPAAQVADDGTGIPPDMLAEGHEGSPPAETNAEPSPNEQIARNIGWRPEAEYRGPKDKWLDADAFMEKVQKETPIMRERLRTLGSEVERLKRENSDYKKREEEGWSELVKRQRAADERGWEYARDTLKRRIREAAANADTAAHDAMLEELEGLEKLKPAPKPEKKPDTGKPDGAVEIDPETQAWLGKNLWFSTDAELNDEMIAEERIILRKIALGQLPNMGTTERLEKAKEKLKERFPTKFGNPARNQPPAASRPGPQGARPAPKKVKTEADLPPSARVVMERLVRQKVLTKKQYLKDYKWDN